MNTFEILYKLESTSSRNKKKQILQENKNNEFLKNILLYAEDNSKVYGIASKSLELVDKLMKDLKINISDDKDFFNICEELMEHPNGSMDDINLVKDFFLKCSEDEKYWYSRVLLKKLKIGCTKTTINEVFENLIPSFDVMLAHPYKKYQHKLIGKEFIIQEKIDGYRLICKVKNGNIEFFTRNGIKIYGLIELEKEIPKLFDCNFNTVSRILDGELIGKNFKDTQHIVFKDGEKTGLVYKIFDMIHIEEFNEGVSILNYFERYNKIIKLHQTKHIRIVPYLYKGKDISQITSWFNYAKSKNWEGVMIKLNSPYECKRSSNILKVKEFNTMDLKVVKLNQGTGKYENILGSVTVNYKNNNIEVGSGFTDNERKLFIDKPELILNKIIEVQYFEETKNDKNEISLRFPVFKCIRLDKSE